MLNWLFTKSLANRVSILFIFLIASLAGAFQISSLPIDAVPDITNVQVMINTKTGALDPERIEKSVTYIIESEMAGLPGLEDIRSLSKYGLSQVTLVFKDGTDLYFVRQQAAQRLQNLNGHLPEGILPELAPITTGLGEVVMYTVDAKKDSALSREDENKRLLYLRTIQDYLIRPELKKIQGVAEVDTNGGFRKEIHVNADTRAMEKYGVTFDDLYKKLRTIGDSYGGGYIQRGGQQVIIRSNSSLPDLEALGAIPIKINFRGQPILLRELAGIREDHTQRVGAATSQGQEAVLGTALMYIGANSREVAANVSEAIANLKLPDDVEINIVYTRSFLVDATIKTVAKNLIEGAILVVLVLLLLLGNFRAAAAVALAIPISMLFAVIGMRFFGISANLMSLGAIDFGLLVDGSVVMIENLLRHLEEKGAGRLTLADKLKLIIESSREVAKPVILGLAIIMVVYAPILSLQGIEGKMFHPMAMTVLMALAASLAVAIFLMPILGYILLNPPAKKARNRTAAFDFIAKLYAPVLRWTISHRSITLALTALFSLTSFILFTRLGSNFIPQLDEGDIVAGLVRDTGISLNESLKEQKKAEELIAAFPEVKHVFSRLGTPESATDPMGINFADTFIILEKDHAKWKLKNKEELKQAIIAKIEAELPGNEISLTQPIAMRFNEILEGSRADVALRIFGPDLDKLIGYIDQSKAIIEKIPGVVEAEMDSLTALRKSPVLNINLNYNSMNRLGVNLHEANSTLMMAMGGIQIGNFYEADRRFPVILHLAEELREDPSEIARIPLSLPEGGSVPLRAIASFDQTEQVTTIARSFGKRYAALSIFLSGRDIAGFVGEAKDRISSTLKLDTGYFLDWGGQFKNLERARMRLSLVIPLTLLVIFILLLRDLRSLRLTLLIYLSIPLAITGGILSLYIRGIPFSVSAAVGFIALLGIAILNGMVMVDFINQLRAKGESVRTAVLHGAAVRLRPVVMTALVAGLGFLPMALNTGLGAEVQRPLATVVIGGILTSTILTLLLLPTMYIWLEERSS